MIRILRVIVAVIDVVIGGTAAFATADAKTKSETIGWWFLAILFYVNMVMMLVE